MDLFEVAGISREAGIGLLALVLVLAVLAAGRLLRRSSREERIALRLSSHRD